MLNKHSDDEDKDPNLVEVVATKIWEKGPATDHESVKLILKRHLGDKEQIVDAIPVIKGKAPRFTYVWSKLDKYSPEGYEYIYSVEEEGVNDGYVMIGKNKYQVKQKGNTITNQYIETPRKPLPPTGQSNQLYVIIGGLILLAAGVFILLKKKANK